MDLAMAQRLVDRRKAAGLSQEALAAQLGVSRQAVSKWERSESSPDTDNLIALAALYGVSLDELLYGEAVDDADCSEDSDAGAEASDEAEEDENEFPTAEELPATIAYGKLKTLMNIRKSRVWMQRS